MNSRKPPAIVAFALVCVAAAPRVPTSEHASPTDAMRLAPGWWVSTMTTDTLELEPAPGHPPISGEALAAARGVIGRAVEKGDCVVAGQAPNDRLLLPGISLGRGCTADILEAGNGRLRYRARCDNGRGFRADMSGDVTYTATTVEGRHSMSGVSPGAGVAVRSTMRMTSRHDGLCRAPPSAPPRG